MGNDIQFKLSLDGKEFMATAGISEDVVKRIATSIKQMESQGKTSFTSLASSWGNIVTGFNQGLQIFERFLDIAKKPIDVAGQFESFEATLRVMLGSADAAKQRLKELSDFAASTPFELPQVVQAANQLQAIGRYSQDNLRMLGDLAAASGKPMEQVLSAYAKLATGQKGIAIDMFRDLLITTDDWAKATGAKFSSSGEIQTSWQNMADALPKILKTKGFDGMMAMQSQTLQGMTSNMNDAFTRMAGGIGDSMLPMAKKVVEGITSIVTAMTPMESELDKATKKADEQRAQFDLLTGRYEVLAQKTNRTKEENELFRGTIDELKRAYPDHLKNLDLEKGKLEDVKKAFKETADEILKNITLRRNLAEVEDLTNKKLDAQAKLKSLTSKITDAKSDSKTKKTDTGKGSRIAHGEYVSTEYQDAANSIAILEKDAKQLEAEIYLYNVQIEGLMEAGVAVKDKEKAAAATIAASASGSQGEQLIGGYKQSTIDEMMKFTRDAGKQQQREPLKIPIQFVPVQDIPGEHMDPARKAQETEMARQQEVWDGFLNNMAGTMRQVGDGLAGSMAAAMTGTKVKWKELLHQMAIMVAQSAIKNAILSIFNIALGGGGGFWGKVFGHATGGIVDKPQFILAGEAGPEIIAPKENFNQVIRGVIESVSAGTLAPRMPSISSIGGGGNQSLIQELRLLRAEFATKDMSPVFAGDLRDDKIFERQRIAFRNKEASRF